MAPNSQEFVQAYSQSMLGEFDDAVTKIKHCTAQLSDAQLWWRPTGSMNSIANLILHLGGNVRQWIVSGVGGTPDTRERQNEFDQQGGLAADELHHLLEEVRREVHQTLEAVTPEELMRQRVVQGNDVNGFEAIVHSVAHFRGHTQEIVHLTRMQMGDDYQFDFVPGPDGT